MVLAATVLAGCGDSEDESATTTTSTEEPAGQSTEISITARDYAFDVPATFEGGLVGVSFSYDNAGKEPHFASFAKIAPGKTIDDVSTALMSPPSAAPPGPPPFEDVLAFSTADPGATGRMTGNLPAGSYALYCSIPSPDGAPHSAKA